MLRAFRLPLWWRSTLRALLIFPVGLTGAIVTGGRVPLANFAQQQSSSQQRLPGQTAPKRASLLGIVRDGAGKPIMAARVTLRNSATQAVLERNADAQGVFRFIDLPPGAYQLEVTQAVIRICWV